MRWLVLALALAACSSAPAPEGPWARRSLSVAGNPFGPGDPLWAPQPHRDRPRAAALSSDGRRLYVALTGSEDQPGESVAVVDVASRKALARIHVGRAPVALALHPGGRYLAVANLYSNWVSVIDTTNNQVVAEPPAPWYTTALAFTADGRRAYLANRWKDSLLGWSVDVRSGFAATPDYLDLPPDGPMGAATGTNPDQVVVGQDGRVYVSSIAGGVIDVFAPDGRTAVGRLAVHSPIGGMLLAGPWLVASHIGRGTGFPPADGVDGDQDGHPGDGTGNVMFQDLQNELEVFDTRTLATQASYTSDSICCRDYRDVDPDRPMRGLLIPAPETWPPERAAAIPARDTWIVAGALPTRMVRLGAPAVGVTRFLTIMAASDQAQRLDLDEATGKLTAVDTAAALYATGHAPSDVVAAPGGAEAYVVDRLGETVSVLDTAHAPGGEPVRVVVGDVSRGAFPASDVELGELFNNVTAPLTVDGDQSCVHCHREGGNLDRVVAMPLQANRLWGSRQVQAYRGAYDTRPWFLEAAMDEKNFFPVLNEFDRKENFCCEELDPVVWSKYPTVTACLAAPAAEGCHHVLHCVDDPPPECAARPYGSSYLTRNELLLAGVKKLTAGRTQSFGDSLVVAGTRQPIVLDFDGVTRAIGLFLLAAPRLLPNPNRALGLASAARGEQLYRRAEVGCQSCHPLPLTTIAVEPDFDPFGTPVRLPPVITPTLAPDGTVADLVTQGFRDTFTVGTLGGALQGPEGIHLGVPQLRGIWDRAPRFFHDGRAHSLKEALLTPGHAALDPGEHGFNERAGVIDTHGGTSQLTRAELDDLMSFLLTL